MNGLSTAHWLISSKTTLSRTVAAILVSGRMRTARDLCRRIVVTARDLAQAGRVGMLRVRAGLVQAAIVTRRALVRAAARSHAASAQFAAAVALHRHGTWLVLFALLFTGLWLLAGWAGMANGVLRGLLVGIATPLLVNALFPLKRTVR